MHAVRADTHSKLIGYLLWIFGFRPRSDWQPRRR